jgi:hypothetical protein
MRLPFVFCLFATLGLGSLNPAYAQWDAGTITVDFDRQSLREEEHCLLEGSFQILRLEDLELTQDVGQPALPVDLIRIYVPQGKDVAAIHIESVRTRDLAGEYTIYPAQAETPLSSAGVSDPVPPDERVYSLSGPYPVLPVRLASVGTVAGRKIAGIQIFPLQYIPTEGRVVLNESITFSLRLTEAADHPRIPSETRNVRNLRNRMVGLWVDNPEDLIRDFPPESGTLDPAAAVEYLILCKDAHRDEYEVLKAWKTRKGVPAKIVTVEEAAATYPGRDVQESYRNCIMDYYLNESTAWVLMTLSAPKAAIRGCYGRVGGTIDNEIPCDLYFSDMDGDWDLDGDLIWGETGDDADLYPDVYVGRITANTGTQCSTVVHKVLTYEGCYTVPVDYQLDMLFMAEYLDDYTNEAVLKNLIDSESVPSRFDPITKLYESSGNLNRTNALSELNAGHNIVNHAGHGNMTIIDIGSDYLTSTDMENLTNGPRYTLFYTVACSPAAFDNVTGCLGRSFLEAPDGGGFFIGNSRVGFYASGSPGQGTGDRYDREFFESIFLRDCINLGVAHADAKVQRIPYSGSYGTNRWQQFTINLLGDPETPVWVDTPVGLAVSHDDTIQTGSQVYTGGARVCLWMGDDLYEVDETGGGGEATFTIAPTNSGTMLVTVVLDGCLPYLGSCSVGSLSGVTGGGRRTPALAVVPNPTAGSASIAYDLPEALPHRAGIRIAIFDPAGRLVAALPVTATAGTVAWDGTLHDGTPAPPGIYFAGLRHGTTSASAKFVLIR